MIDYEKYRGSFEIWLGGIALLVYAIVLTAYNAIAYDPDQNLLLPVQAGWQRGTAALTCAGAPTTSGRITSIEITETPTPTVEPEPTATPYLPPFPTAYPAPPTVEPYPPAEDWHTIPHD